MAPKLSFLIFARNLVGKGVAAAKREMAGLARIAGGARAAFRGLGRALSVVKMGFVAMAAGVAGAAAALWKTIQTAFRFEAITTQFKVLFKDLQRAREHMEALADFSARTPFQLEGIADASRLLEVFTGGVLNTEAGLKLVGDAAAAAGRDIQEVAMWVGRAYTAIKAGQPFGEAAQRLQEMGLLTGEARAELERLQKAGASNAQIWGVLRRALEGFEGGMQELSETGEGLVSTLKDNLNLAMRDFGDVFVEKAKDAIKSLIGWLQRLRSDGTLKDWAERAKSVLETAVTIGKALATDGGVRQKALIHLKDLVVGAFRKGAEIAVDLLLKAAPMIGSLILKGATALATTPGETMVAADLATMTVKREKERRESTGEAPMSLKEEFRMFREEMKAEQERLRSERLRQERERVGQQFNEETGGRRTADEQIQDALKGFAALAEELKPTLAEQNAEREKAIGRQIQEMEGLDLATVMKQAAGKLGISIDAIAEMTAEKYAAYLDVVDALIAAEEERIAAEEQAAQAAAEAAALAAAEAKTRKEAIDKLARLSEKEFGQEAIDQIRRSEKYDEDTASGLADFVKAVEDLIPKLREQARKKEEREQKDRAKRAEKLEERVQEFRVTQLKPAQELKDREKRLAEMERDVEKEDDPEKRLKLAEQIQAEFEKIVGLRQAADEEKRTQLGIEDVFDRIAGTPADKDPRLDTLKSINDHNARMEKWLEEIAGKEGGVTD